MEETGAADAFTRMGTLGIEEEFYVVDEHGRPTSGTDELVYEHDPPALLEGRLDHELFKCVIETQTPVIESIAEARATTSTRSAARSSATPLTTDSASPPRVSTRWRSGASRTRRETSLPVTARPDPVPAAPQRHRRPARPRRRR